MSKKEEKEVSKLEKIYNIILLITTILTIILLVMPLIGVIKMIVTWVGGTVVGLEDAPAKPELLLSIPLVGAITGYMFIPFVIASFISQIVLFVMAIRYRKVKTRKPRWYEFIYLFALVSIYFIALFSMMILSFAPKILVTVLSFCIGLGVQIDFILLIIILINNKNKEVKEKSSLIADINNSELSIEEKEDKKKKLELIDELANKKKARRIKTFKIIVIILGINLFLYILFKPFTLDFYHNTSEYNFVYEIDEETKVYSKFEKTYYKRILKKDLSKALADKTVTMDKIIDRMFINRDTDEYIVYDSNGFGALRMNGYRIYIIKCISGVNKNYYIVDDNNNYHVCKYTHEEYLEHQKEVFGQYYN